MFVVGAGAWRVCGDGAGRRRRPESPGVLSMGDDGSEYEALWREVIANTQRITDLANSIAARPDKALVEEMKRLERQNQTMRMRMTQLRRREEARLGSRYR